MATKGKEGVRVEGISSLNEEKVEESLSSERGE